MSNELILVADEGSDLREAICWSLVRGGFRTLEAPDPDSTLHVAADQPIDLLLLDHTMPVAEGSESPTGFDLLRLLKATPATRDIPVIILSAAADEVDRVMGLELGAHDYICKPFSLRELVTRVRTVLRNLRTLPTRGPLGPAEVVVKPIFVNRAFIRRTNYCFVLMPFSEPWSERVWKHLRDLVRSLGFTCKRADELYGHNILEDIWTAINEASVLVADVTGRNPNVMYEVGIAHTLGKDAILLTQDLRDIPFDFRAYRHLKYEDNVEGFGSMSTLLPNYLQERRATTSGIQRQSKRDATEFASQSHAQASRAVGRGPLKKQPNKRMQLTRSAKARRRGPRS